MKRFVYILLAVMLLLAMTIPGYAVSEGTFDYRLELTDSTGKTIQVNDLHSMQAGETIHLNIHLERTDVDAISYGIYGIEFQVSTKGLAYQEDGVCFNEGISINQFHYTLRDVVGFAFIDLEMGETTIPNPLDVAQWSYRVRMRVTKETSLWDTVYGCTEYPICPRCNSSLDREYQNYCDRCGQALDWHRKKRRPASPKPDV